MIEAEEASELSFKKDNEKSIHYIVQLVIFTVYFQLFISSLANRFTVNFIFKKDFQKNDSKMLGSYI